ncbi:MAG: hypothetical protein M3416_03770 [Acidobacteriota bacterium]|nr:hypothetical protein [Acidobacteriota bacterium]
MGAHRHNSEARSLAAASTVTSVSLVERGPAEGEYETKWVPYYRQFAAKYTSGGRVYDGVGPTEGEARARAKALADEMRARDAEAARGKLCPACLEPLPGHWEKCSFAAPPDFDDSDEAAEWVGEV